MSAYKTDLFDDSNGLFMSSFSTISSSSDLKQTPEIDRNEVKFEEKIGGGCFGNVYRGKCRGKNVAIKKLLNQDMDDHTLEEFRKEVEIMTFVFDYAMDECI